MPIDYEHLVSLRSRGARVSYTDRDVILYALAVNLGAGQDGQELPFVSELAGLRVLPTLAGVLVPFDFLDDCGWDPDRVMIRSESISLERPLEDAGTLLVDSEVVAVRDRGGGEGAVIELRAQARRERDESPVFSLQRTLLARGEGGFGGPRGEEATAHPMPARPPDLAERITTRPDQALLFRLCGDRSPVHVDPAAARRAGFSRPVLHSQCLAGLACHALLRVICEYDHTLITGFAAGFPGSASPGEPLLAEFWQDANIVSFRLRAPERDAIVLDHGRCVLAA